MNFENIELEGCIGCGKSVVADLSSMAVCYECEEEMLKASFEGYEYDHNEEIS
jgi:hypothetical protein